MKVNHYSYPTGGKSILMLYSVTANLYSCSKTPQLKYQLRYKVMYDSHLVHLDI